MRLLSILIGLAVVTPALAQVQPQVHPQAHPGHRPYPGAAIGAQHRYEMDRLRQQRLENQRLADQNRYEAQRRIDEVQAARPPAIAAPRRDPGLARETQRRESVQEGLAGLDAWIDRSRPEP